MVSSKKHIAIAWGSKMIIPIVLDIDTNTEYTKQNSKAAFKRLREQLSQYGILLKSQHYDPTLLLTQLRDKCDPCISEIIRKITEEVLVTTDIDWDGTYDTLPTLNIPFILAGVSTNVTPKSKCVEFIHWHEMDLSKQIESLKRTRKNTRLPKDMQISEIWNTFFAPIYSYVPINRIEIIDRYLLKNILNVKEKSQLENYLTMLNQCNTNKQKNITIYSSQEDLLIEDIQSYIDSILRPLCEQLPCISSLRVLVCKGYEFRTHYHDRYIISTAKQEVISYVHKLGIGLEVLEKDKLKRSQECSLTVHNQHTVKQYRDMLNVLANSKIACYDIIKIRDLEFNFT